LGCGQDTTPGNLQKQALTSRVSAGRRPLTFLSRRAQHAQVRLQYGLNGQIFCNMSFATDRMG